MSEKIPPELEVLLTHLDWNLQRLVEVLKQEQSDYFKGAALQRFGHTYNITIKVIQAFAEWKDLPCQTDEQCLETAVQNGWMEKQSDIKEMADDYQRINQKPQQDAENIYQKLTVYQKSFTHLFLQLKNIS
ncbi:MAG: hypothetical protein HOK41_12425 [Nitrospina sp.]|jgi:hypothetical protein|nr:hypothetical protein [Nitrospina sp.]MBT6718531.1 hypothetical protein [Nitrospina sp.]